MTVVRVTTTTAVVLRHAVELAHPKVGENRWETQARTLDELGYRIVGRDDAPAPADVPQLSRYEERAVDVCRRMVGEGLAGHDAIAVVLDALDTARGTERDVSAHETWQRAAGHARGPS